MFKEAKGTSDIGTSLMPEQTITQDLETIEEEEKPALDATETNHTCNHLNSISDNILNSYMSPLITKSPTPTPPNYPTSSSKHTSSPKLDKNLSIGSIMPYPKPTSESEIVPGSSALENLTSQIAGELPSE